MAAQPPPVVRVGVAAVVRDAQGRMVMGIRKGPHGGGWWPPILFQVQPAAARVGLATSKWLTVLSRSLSEASLAAVGYVVRRARWSRSLVVANPRFRSRPMAVPRWPPRSWGELSRLR